MELFNRELLREINAILGKTDKIERKLFVFKQRLIYAIFGAIVKLNNPPTPDGYARAKICWQWFCERMAPFLQTTPPEFDVYARCLYGAPDFNVKVLDRLAASRVKETDLLEFMSQFGAAPDGEGGYIFDENRRYYLPRPPWVSEETHNALLELIRGVDRDRAALLILLGIARNGTDDEKTWARVIIIRYLIQHQEVGLIENAITEMENLLELDDSEANERLLVLHRALTAFNTEERK